MRTMLLTIAILACGLPGFAQDTAEVDQYAVLRLGNLVQSVGNGPRATPEVDCFAEAMAPPANDADKWFISVLSMKGCSGCEQLKFEWQRNESLLALANPADPKQSWAHYNAYDWSDKSQHFRFEKIKVSVFPTVIVQPPRTGKYGDPATVVFQCVYENSPEKLARAITTAIRQYISKRQKESAVAGVGRGYGADPPWTPTPRVDPFQTIPQPAPQPTFDPTIPPPTPAVASLGWVSILWPVVAPAAVAGIAWAVTAIRAKRQAEGKQPLVNQATLDEMLALLKKLAENPPTASAKA